MGTRADFYVGKGKDAEWVGSIAYDGHPGNYPEIEKCSTEEDYRTAVKGLFSEVSHATRPEQGWPWPWKDSGTSDYAYCFVDGKVLITAATVNNGIWTHVWVPAMEYKDIPAVDGDCFLDSFERCEFPDMSSRSKVTFGPRSGMLFVR